MLLKILRGFKSGMKDTEDQAVKMKKTVSEAFNTVKESMLRELDLVLVWIYGSL